MVAFLLGNCLHLLFVFALILTTCSTSSFCIGHDQKGKTTKFVANRSSSRLHIVEVPQIIGFIEVSVFALALPACRDAYDKFRAKGEERTNEKAFEELFYRDYAKRRGNKSN